MKRIIIAIDGYSGTGKSSTAKEVANRLAIKYIDSGAMYRAVTLYALKNKIPIDDKSAIEQSMENILIDFDHNNEVMLNGDSVAGEIRSMEVNTHVSKVSTYSDVREAMVAKQRELSKSSSIVMDGRDIGSVVFPQADLKVFMTADVEVRARRRQMELEENGISEELSVIERNLRQRDKIDSSRDHSPLVKSINSIEIDTSYLKFEEQIDRIVSLAKELMHED